MNIIQKLLDPKEYVREKTKKTAVVWHHTAGSHRPDNQINYWGSDSLGRVATHYVIGGVSLTGDTTFDGVVYQAIPEEYCGLHLGIKGNGQRFDKQSIGIEICNYGYLVKNSKTGKYYNYVGHEVPEYQVYDLGFEWRGYRYWHKYTGKQLNALQLLTREIGLRHSISFGNSFGVDYMPELLKLQTIKGLYVHSNFRKDKFDCPGQQNIISLAQWLAEGVG